jgi:hypothetical protein
VGANRKTIFIASLVGAGIAATAAIAVATPLTPRPGATVTTAHPDFTWTLPLNEDTVAIYIADKPDVTSAGEFYSENVVDGADLLPGVGEWSPAQPLYAGEYWWNVLSTDPSTHARFYSPPAEFTIPVALRLNRITAKRFTFPRRRLWIEVIGSANVKRPLLRARLLNRRRIVWKAAHRVFGNVIPGAYGFYWYPHRRGKQGTRLRLIVSISLGGVVRTRSLVVRAP